MNDYQQAFNELRDKDTFRGQQWFGKRKELVDEYSWAIPNREALVYLAEFGKITEVGAGSGYWANCINEQGGNVRATDIDPPADTYVEVEQVSVQDLDLTGEAVLTVWPPYDEQMASRIPKQNPNHIVYVGEPEGGCTGDSEFFHELDRQYGLVAKVDIPSFAGIHDDLFHYVRKV